MQKGKEVTIFRFQQLLGTFCQLDLSKLRKISFIDKLSFVENGETLECVKIAKKQVSNTIKTQKLLTVRIFFSIQSN